MYLPLKSWTQEKTLYSWPRKTATSTEGKRQLSNPGYFGRAWAKGVRGRSRQDSSCFKQTFMAAIRREEKLKPSHISSLGYWWLASPLWQSRPCTCTHNIHTRIKSILQNPEVHQGFTPDLKRVLSGKCRQFSNMPYFFYDISLLIVTIWTWVLW